MTAPGVIRADTAAAGTAPTAVYDVPNAGRQV